MVSEPCKSAALEVLPANFSQLRGHGCASTSSALSQPTNVEPCVSRVISTAPVVVQTSSNQLQMPPVVDVIVIGDQHTRERSAGLTSEGTSSPTRSQIAGVGEPAAAIGADISVETGQEVLNRDSITANSAGQSFSSGPGNVHSDTANTADRIEAIEDSDAIHIAGSRGNVVNMIFYMDCYNLFVDVMESNGQLQLNSVVTIPTRLG
ncbi:hypothetical protein V6N11_011266 [Hibiscus sabdariffa]|uniref:Uncharacterized protein n=1 Tax=Hibiscus sabdariffa TaxID=183260 RepID=A0ABR2S7W5_9ROSI